MYLVSTCELVSNSHVLFSLVLHIYTDAVYLAFSQCTIMIFAQCHTQYMPPGLKHYLSKLHASTFPPPRKIPGILCSHLRIQDILQMLLLEVSVCISCMPFQKWKLLTFIFAGLTKNVLQLVVIELGSNVMKCYDTVQTAKSYH